MRFSEWFEERKLIAVALMICVAIVILSVYDTPDLVPAGIVYFGNDDVLTTSDVKIDINTADAAQLMALEGIGEAMARKIIEYRETHGGFASIDELKQVDGIGDSIFGKISPFVAVY